LERRHIGRPAGLGNRLARARAMQARKQLLVHSRHGERRGLDRCEPAPSLSIEALRRATPARAPVKQQDNPGMTVLRLFLREAGRLERRRIELQAELLANLST